MNNCKEFPTPLNQLCMYKLFSRSFLKVNFFKTLRKYDFKIKYFAQNRFT